MGRTLVIGDVHGCVDELSNLLSACEHGPVDQVVLVGDLVAKGPDSPGVLALVRELGATRDAIRARLRNDGWPGVIDRLEELLAQESVPTGLTISNASDPVHPAPSERE